MRKLFLWIIILGVWSFINCSPVQFTKLRQNQNNNQNTAVAFSKLNSDSADIAIPPVKTIQCSQDFAKIPVKVLFVVDTSGSNSLAYNGAKGGNYVPATDPHKKFRGGSISEFFEKYKDKPNFSWGFEIFSRNYVLSYIGQNTNAIFGNARAMEGAIDAFAMEQDRGMTPYLKALEGIRVAIANDSDLHSKAEYPPLYYVVFMSDGYPTDSTGAQVNSAIEDIISLDPARISLSTIYYGTQNDPEAAGTLQNMASSGGGQFVNFDMNSNETIDIQDLIGLPTTTCQ